MCEKKWQNPLLIFFCNFWERQFELALCIGHALKLKTGAFASSVTGWKLKLALFVKFVDGQIGALKMTAFFLPLSSHQSHKNRNFPMKLSGVMLWECENMHRNFQRLS